MFTKLIAVVAPLSLAAVGVSRASPPPTPGPAGFANATPLQIPNQGPARPSPSSIQVTGMPANFERIVVTLHGLSHTFVFDVEVLVVSPAGHGVVLMSSAGGTATVTNLTLQFDDEAGRDLPGGSGGPALTSGRYRPTDLLGPSADFGPAAPPGPHGSKLEEFAGADPNGAWNLYVFDSSPEDAGAVDGGWSLHFLDKAGRELEPIDPTALDRWQIAASASPEPPSIAVAGSPGGFVSVGGRDARVSPDGVRWTRAPLADAADLLAIGGGEGLWIAAGSNGVLLTSADGQGWTRRSQGKPWAYFDVAQGAGRWVAVGTGGATAVSLDGGLTWQEGLEAKTDLRAAAFGLGGFVAVGGDTIHVSTNGSQWKVLPALPNVDLRSVAFGNRRFVAVGHPRVVLLSFDGVHWSRHSPPGEAGSLRKIVHSGWEFLCGGTGGTLLSSVDGSNWISRPVPPDLAASSIEGLASDGQLVIAATLGTTNRLWRSDPLHRRPPQVVVPPHDTVVRAGASTNFTFIAAGTSPMRIQWMKNGQTLANATNPSLAIANAQAASEGAYAVRLSNALGSATSAPGRLTLGVPPTVVWQPLDQSVPPGGNAVFSVGIQGSPPFYFRWRRPISLFTTLTSSEPQSFWMVTNAGAAGAGVYGVQVSNDYGGVTTRGARLTLLGDTDHDGLPDGWEMAHGLNANDPADARRDADGDGLSNLGEFTSGTNPTNGASALRLRMGWVAGQCRLEFDAVSNQTYAVQSAGSLGPGAWSAFVALPAQTGTRRESISVPVDSGQRFFRVVTPYWPAAEP